MSVDRKTSQGFSLIELLAIPPFRRTTADIEIISRLTLNYKFFQEIVQKEDSAKLQQDCCKVLTAKSYLKDEYVCRKGDEADAFFVILRGSVVVLSCEGHEIDNKSNYAKSQVEDLKSSQNLNLEEEEKEEVEYFLEKEIAILASGQSFGEMALINDHERYFSVKCLEPTILGVLHKNDYHTLANIHQKMINEKIEFLRGMEAFKNWSKLAVQKLSYFFKTQKYRKANIVYKEGDPPSDIFIIKEGEFMFTQNFLIESGLQTSGYSFGSLNKKRPEQVFRKKQLKIVVKQQGEIFGYDEIFNTLPGREFTCTCLTKQGELLIISDKNFAKKVVHPETLKFIEDACKTFKGWTSSRIETLKSVERVKDSVTYTPYAKLQSFRKKSDTPEVRLPVLHSPPPVTEKKLTILEKFYLHPRGRSFNRKEENVSRSDFFSTEIQHKSFEAGRRSRLGSTLGANKQKSFIY
jgi:CRP-like cAMP-binding protein